MVPSLPVEEGPRLNALRWCVVVPITEPLNTSDVLQLGTLLSSLQSILPYFAYIIS